MPGNVMPFVLPQWLTNSGAPAVGYKLFCYGAGTSTKATTYSDYALSVPNTNPIVLDSSGRAPVFLTPGIYKFVMALNTDTDPPSVPIWTIDNVSSIPLQSANIDVSGIAGESIALNAAVFLSDGTGGKTAGRWYNMHGDAAYSSTAAKQTGFALGTYSAAQVCSVRIEGQLTGLAGLSTGSVYYASATPGAVTLTPPAYPQVVGVADSTTSLILSPQLVAATLPAALHISRGGTYANPNGIGAAITLIAWYASYNCTVTAVKGYRVGGSGATVNARRNGSLTHLASDLSLTSSDTYMDGGAVQNASYAAGDKLEIMVTGVTGAPTAVAVQVELSVP